MTLDTPITTMTEVLPSSDKCPAVILNVKEGGRCTFPVSFENPRQAHEAVKVVKRIRQTHHNATMTVICFYNNVKNMVAVTGWPVWCQP
uniref:Uncharacterized protein n=1 Tax=Panagrellus redivivus TaxID=6233 RepID=A0A7E4VSP3_PANRE